MANSEAFNLLQLIDETKLKRKEDIIFVRTIRAKVKSNAEISNKQIYWLRDLKDKQLDSESDRSSFREYSDRRDKFQD